MYQRNVYYDVILTVEHGGTPWEDGVGVQVLPDVDIALHDGIVGSLVDTNGFHSQEWWLEEGLWVTEPLVSDSDDLWKYNWTFTDE